MRNKFDWFIFMMVSALVLTTCAMIIDFLGWYA